MHVFMYVTGWMDGWMGMDGDGWGWMGMDGDGWGWMGMDGEGWMDGWLASETCRVQCEIKPKRSAFRQRRFLRKPKLATYTYTPLHLLKHSEFELQSPTKRITPGCGSKPNLAFQVS